LKIPFPAVTFCPDLLSHNKVFDYNQLVTALNQHEMTIDNVTSEEFVYYSVRDQNMRYKFAFRLKYMQAIGLATGDEFLIPFNLTIDAEDVLDYMAELRVKWYTPGYTNFAFFDDYYGVEFAEITGASGFCYNFNMPEAAELLQLNAYVD
jgi:hypothetical protein